MTQVKQETARRWFPCHQTHLKLSVMKTLMNTPEMLILDHKPWVLSLGMLAGLLIFMGVGIGAMTQGEWLFGLMFAGIGGLTWGGCFLVFAKRVQLIFDTQAGQIVKRKRSFFGYAQDVYPLDAFRGVKIEESRSDGSTTYRPVLMFDGQPDLPVVSYYTNGRQPHRTAQAINGWRDGNPALASMLDSDPQSQ